MLGRDLQLMAMDAPGQPHHSGLEKSQQAEIDPPPPTPECWMCLTSSALEPTGFFNLRPRHSPTWSFEFANRGRPISLLCGGRPPAARIGLAISTPTPPPPPGTKTHASRRPTPLDTTAMDGSSSPSGHTTTQSFPCQKSGATW